MDNFVLVHMIMYIIAIVVNVTTVLRLKTTRLPFMACVVIVGHMMLGFWAYTLLYPINFFD